MTPMNLTRHAALRSMAPMNLTRRAALRSMAPMNLTRRAALRSMARRHGHDGLTPVSLAPACKRTPATTVLRPVVHLSERLSASGS